MLFNHLYFILFASFLLPPSFIHQSLRPLGLVDRLEIQDAHIHECHNEKKAQQVLHAGISFLSFHLDRRQHRHAASVPFRCLARSGVDQKNDMHLCTPMCRPKVVIQDQPE